MARPILCLQDAMTSAATQDFQAKPKDVVAAEIRFCRADGRYTDHNVFDREKPKTFDISISSFGVDANPSCIFVQAIGTTIKKAINIGVTLEDIYSSTRTMKDVTGVALIRLLRGDRKADRSSDFDVMIPIKQPVIMPKAKPIRTRRKVPNTLSMNTSVSISLYKVFATTKGPGSNSSLPMTIEITCQISIHAAKMTIDWKYFLYLSLCTVVKICTRQIAANALRIGII